MPVLHEYKTLFFHPCRTGGTSIEKALNIPEECLWRKIYKNNKKIKGMQHARPKEVIDNSYWTGIDREIFNNYFKFSFVRNPFDYVVSYWLWRKLKKSSSLSLSEFLDESEFYFNKKNLQKKRSEKNTIWYVGCPTLSSYTHDDKGKKVVDFIGRFENLQSDFDDLCSKINYPKTILCHELPSQTISFNLSKKESKQYREKKMHYSFFFKNDKKLIDRVYKMYEIDFINFGYSYEEVTNE